MFGERLVGVAGGWGELNPTNPQTILANAGVRGICGGSY